MDDFGLSIGSVSVGLPTACTVDAVLLRYLDLIRLVRRNEHPSSLAPGRDVDVLAHATRLEPATVRTRLLRLGR